MAESEREEDTSSHDPVVKTVADRWAKLAAQLKRFRGPIAAIAAFGAILSGLLGYWSAYQTVEKTVVLKASTTTSEPPLLSVAVMPFVPATGSPDDGRFAERVTQDLTSSIERRLRSAQVVSYGLMTKYQEKLTDPRTLGRDLNVRYLVEGDIRANDGTTAFVARLVETANGTTVSSTRVADGPSTGGHDETSLVAQLSSQISEMLYEAEERRVARLPISDANAMELVLRADRIWDQDSSPKGLLAARKLYQEAARRDPDSVPALFGLFWTGEEQVSDLNSPNQDQAIEEMDKISRRALSLDRDNPRGWYARANALMYQQQWDRALEANAAALQIDPYRNQTVGDRGFLLLLTGHPEEALPVLERAIGLDPRSSNVHRYLQWQCSAYLNLGQYDQAIAACERSLALADDDWIKYLFLLGAYAQKGDMVKAEATKAALLKRKPNVSIAGLKTPGMWTNPRYQEQREAHLYVGLRKVGIPEQ